MTVIYQYPGLLAKCKCQDKITNNIELHIVISEVSNNKNAFACKPRQQTFCLMFLYQHNFISHETIWISIVPSLTDPKTSLNAYSLATVNSINSHSYLSQTWSTCSVYSVIEFKINKSMCTINDQSKFVVGTPEPLPWLWQMNNSEVLVWWNGRSYQYNDRVSIKDHIQFWI